MTRGNTCLFGHHEHDILVMTHGDDFVSAADIEDLRWLESILKEEFEITTDIIGHEEESKKQLKMMYSFISVKRRWVHVRARCQTFGDDRQGVWAARCENTPVSNTSHESEELVDHDRFDKYQSLRTQANLLAIDTIVLQVGAKE